MDYQNNEPVRSGDYGNNGTQYAVPEQPKKGLSIATLIFGILSLLGLCCCGLNLLTAPIAIILGIIALAKKRAGTGLAITGIVLAILSLAVVGLLLFSVRDVLPYSQEITTDYMQVLNDQDEVFPAYEADGTLPDYLKKYEEAPLKDVLDNHNVTIQMIMDTLLQQYKSGQLPKYNFTVAQPAGNAQTPDADAEVSLNPAI